MAAMAYGLDQVGRPIHGIDLSGPNICLLDDHDRADCFGQIYLKGARGRGLRAAGDVSASAAGFCATTRRGAVDCIWWDRAGRRSRIRGVRGAREVSIGLKFGCARIDSGAVACWRAGDTKGEWSGVLDAVSISVSNELCVVHRDGAVTCRSPDTGIRRISGIVRAVALDINYGLGCARIAEGSVACWRSAAFPQAGLPMTDGEPLDHAVSIPGMTDVVDVGVGSGGLACAVDGSGRVGCVDGRGVVPASKLDWRYLVEEHERSQPAPGG